MNKKVKIFIILLSVILLTACGSTEDGNKVNNKLKMDVKEKDIEKEELEVKRYENGYFLVGKDIPPGNYQLYVNPAYSSGDYYVYSDESKNTELYRASFNYTIPATFKEGEYVWLRGYYAEREEETKPQTLTYGAYRVGEEGIIKPGLHSFVYTGMNGDAKYGFFSIINSNNENSKYVIYSDYEVFEERVYRINDQNYKTVKYELKEGQRVELFHVDILNLD